MDSPDLVSDRITLRLIRSSDVDIIFALRSNAEVQKYIDRDPYTRIEEAEVQVKKVLGLMKSKKSVVWIICMNDSNRKMGSICLWNFSADRNTAEVGYDMLPENQGKGYMSEALKLVLKYGKTILNLIQIEAFTSRYNLASMALLENNDFLWEMERTDKDNQDNRIYVKIL